MATAMAVSHWIEVQTGWSIKKLVRTARRYRTVRINPGGQTLTAADPVVVRDRSAAGLPTTCKNVDLNGVAVEGPLRTPTIVIDGPPECRGTVIEESRGVVVIPAPDSKAAP